MYKYFYISQVQYTIFKTKAGVQGNSLLYSSFVVSIITIDGKISQFYTFRDWKYTSKHQSLSYQVVEYGNIFNIT